MRNEVSIMKVEVQPITGQKLAWKIRSWPTPEGKIQKIKENNESL
jgi:hypothetical protein